MRRFTRLLIILLGWLLTACDDAGSGSVPATGSAAQPVLNFDAAELSTSIRPQDDFWGYVNANWIERTPIPADRSGYGSFHIVADRTENQIRDLVEELTASQADQQAVGALYASFLDAQRIDAAGLAPLLSLFDRVDAMQDTKDVARLMGEFAAFGVTGLIRFYHDNDAYDARRLIMYLWQGGLGLPNRDYYVADNPKLEETRHAYAAHIGRMFELAQWADGAAAAAAIVALETEIAHSHWDAVANRDRQKIYANQFGFDDAAEVLGEFDLAAWWHALGAPNQAKLVLAQTSFFAGLGDLITRTPMSVWRSYARFHLLSAMAPLLSEPLAAENFAFFGATLRGQKAQAERWKRGVRLVNQHLGEPLGKAYVARHFPEHNKQEISALVENLRAAFAQSIQNLEWMGAATKAAALTKLEAFLPKLGYPDEWRDFGALRLAPDTLVDNVLTASRFNMDYELSLLEQPAERGRWTTNAQTVNAYYRPTHNSITFPAGILQAPFFVADGDPAGNYGAIGTIIGHEFSHGFDDQGRKFDGEGLLKNWWSPEDAAKYEKRAAVLVEQYNAFKPLPDKHVNGALTLGENIGDLAGVLMAYKAFELSGHADGPPVEGLTPRQRFFIGFAMAFRAKYREPYLREMLVSDPHSPSQYRVMGVLPNVPAFYEAFNVTPADAMYLAPEQRAKIW